jgi:hypothetical protein
MYFCLLQVYGVEEMDGVALCVLIHGGSRNNVLFCCS